MPSFTAIEEGHLPINPVRNRPVLDKAIYPVQNPASASSGHVPGFGQGFRTIRLMPRTFAYLRVSTASQTTDNQLAEIQAVGFACLLDRLEAGNMQANADMRGRSIPQAGSLPGGY